MDLGPRQTTQIRVNYANTIDLHPMVGSTNGMYPSQSCMPLGINVALIVSEVSRSPHINRTIRVRVDESYSEALHANSDSRTCHAWHRSRIIPFQLQSSRTPSVRLWAD